MEESIYPLIVMDYYPLRIDMNENKNSIFMCNNEQEVEKLISLYQKEIGNKIRNLRINTKSETIIFQYADTYFDENTIIEESDWFNKEISFESLKTFPNEK